MEIAHRISSRRVALGMTQEQIRIRLELERVFVSRSNFSRLEQGRRLPNAAEIIALAEVLGVTIDWLLIGKGKDLTQ